MPESPDVLQGGAWVPRGPRLVWQPKKPEPPRKPDPRLLVACPTCRARVTQTCRTRSGHTTKPHGSRLAPRLCECGVVLAPRRRYCDECRDRIDRENRYAGVLRWRAQQRGEVA